MGDADKRKLVSRKQGDRRVRKAITSRHEALDTSHNELGDTERQLDLARRKVHGRVEAAIRMLREHEAGVMAEIDEIQNKQGTSQRVLQKELDLKIVQLTSGVEHKAVISRTLLSETLQSDLTIAQLRREFHHFDEKQKPKHVMIPTVYRDNEETDQAHGKLVVKTWEVDPCCCTVEITNDVSEIQLRILTRNRMGELRSRPDESLCVKMVENEALNTTKGLKPIKTFGSLTSKAGALKSPCGITVDRRNRILIADTSNHRVQVFNTDGVYQQELGDQAEGHGEIKLPLGVTVDRNNNVILSDRGNNRIQVLKPDGVFIRSIGEGRVERPCGVCVSSEGDIVVCSREKKRGIKMFSKEGVFLREFSNQHQHKNPSYITFTNGKYYVSYPGEHCVRVYDSNGQFIRQFGSYGQDDGQFDRPHGLAVYRGTYLLVCDYWNHRVQVLTLDGECVGTFGSQGEGLGEMSRPIDVTVLPDGTVMVLEYYNDRVHVWR